MECNSEYFIFNKKKSGDNSLGELLIRVLLVKLVEATRWIAKDKWQHPQTLPMLQVATSLHLGS